MHLHEALLVQFGVGGPVQVAEGNPVTPLRVMVVDDHRVFADALSVCLDAEPDLQVVASPATVEEAEAVADAHELDVAVVDVDLGRSDGIELTQRLRALRPGLRVVILTCHDDGATAAAAVRVGASAFVTKEAAGEELVEAIRAVHRGESLIPPRLLTEVLRDLQAGEDHPTTWEEQAVARLSAREREVLTLMIAGHDRAAIARRLFLSPNTIRTHTQNVLAKLGVHSSLEAVGIGLRAGLRPPSS